MIAFDNDKQRHRKTGNRSSRPTEDSVGTFLHRPETGNGSFDLLVINGGKGHPAMYLGLTSEQCSVQATIH